MTIAPTTALLLLGGSVIVFGLFIYSVSELAAFRSRMAMRELNAVVDRERVTTRRLLEQQRQGSSVYASPPAA